MKGVICDLMYHRVKKYTNRRILDIVCIAVCTIIRLVTLATLQINILPVSIKIYRWVKLLFFFERAHKKSKSLWNYLCSVCFYHSSLAIKLNIHFTLTFLDILFLIKRSQNIVFMHIHVLIISKLYGCKSIMNVSKTVKHGRISHRLRS